MNRAKFPHGGLLAINPAALGLEFVLSGPADRKNRTIGDVAVVDVRGPLEYHAGGFFDSYDAIKERVRDALSSQAKAVVLAFDSPGGLVSGVYETSTELRAMAQAARKPMYSCANGECCSAAFALACAGERIFVPMGAIVGSIGVIALAVDATAADKAMGIRFEAISSGRRKTDGNPHVAMTDDAVASMQKTVDAQASVFFALVGQTRGMSPEAVRGFQAGMFVGAQAVEVGLADELASLDELVARIGAGTVTKAASSAKESAMYDMKEVRKALGEAASGDGDEAKKARTALAALDGGEKEPDGDEGGDADTKKKDDEAKAAKAKAEAADGEKKKDDEAKAAKAKAETDTEAAKAAASNVVSLASRVQTLEAERQAAKDAAERTELMASRPDLVPDVRTWLEKQPLPVIRDAVKALPKGPLTAISLAAAAQSGVRPTMGAMQITAQGAALEQSQLERMNEQMGLGRNPMKAISFDGVTQTVRTMTREDAEKYASAKVDAARVAAAAVK